MLVAGFDPRAHLMENVVRRNAIDRSPAPGAIMEGIDTINTLANPIVRDRQSVR
jgi:hypothetical protein